MKLRIISYTFNNTLDFFLKNPLYSYSDWDLKDLLSYLLCQSQVHYGCIKNYLLLKYCTLIVLQFLGQAPFFSSTFWDTSLDPKSTFVITLMQENEQVRSS